MAESLLGVWEIIGRRVEDVVEISKMGENKQIAMFKARIPGNPVLIRLISKG